MLSFGEPAAMAEEAVAMNEQFGVNTFKVKVGRAPALDVAAVRAIRAAVPDADLYVDANRGWSYDDAVRAGDQLADLGVRAIEEPIAIEDRAGRRRLADRGPCRWSAMRAASASRTSIGRSRRARSVSSA